MGAIFTSPARPFYQSVTLYHLDRLPLDRYTAFCVAHFKKKGKKLDDAVVSRLYSQFDGVTYYMQRVMNELFSKTAADATCTEDDVSMAVDEIIAVSSPIYEDLMYQLPEKQSRVLIAVAKDGCAENVTGGKFIKRHGYIKDLGLGFSSEYLIEKFHKIQEDNPHKEYNAIVGLTLKEAIKEKFGSEIDHIYISDEDTGDIFIDEQ